jgi:hypothetical protein
MLFSGQLFRVSRLGVHLAARPGTRRHGSPLGEAVWPADGVRLCWRVHLSHQTPAQASGHRVPEALWVGHRGSAGALPCSLRRASLPLTRRHATVIRRREMPLKVGAVRVALLRAVVKRCGRGRVCVGWCGIDNGDGGCCDGIAADVLNGVPPVRGRSVRLAERQALDDGQQFHVSIVARRVRPVAAHQGELTARRLVITFVPTTAADSSTSDSVGGRRTV